jgi:hypothetical protein
MNYPKRASMTILPGLALAAALAGCSAGTTGSLPTPTIAQPGSGANAGRSEAETAKAVSAAMKAPRAGIFLSSTAPRSASPYRHIWASLVKVELLNGTGSAQTVWEASEPLTVDLAALAGTPGATGTSRFLALAGAAVAGGKPTERVRLTFGKSFELYTAGAQVAETALIADTVAKDAEGRPAISYPLSRARDLSTGKENLVVDFDLTALAVKDGKVTPAVRDGDTAGLADDKRQEIAEFAGTATGLSGASPETRFVLTPGAADTGAMLVQTSAATTLYNDDATPSPALAENRKVRVRGRLSPETKRIVATEIVTVPGDKDAGPAHVAGAVSHLNADDKTFVLDAAAVEGLAPTQAAVTVTIAPDAVLRSSSGLLLTGDAFWAALKAQGASGVASVAGVYDPVTGSLTASRAKIEGMTNGGTREADAEGAPKSIDATAKTFTLSAPLTRWDGMAAPNEKSKGIPVAITAATEFRNDAGEFLAPDHFFAQAAQKDKVVRVIGQYSPKGAFTATRVELHPRPVPVAAAAPPAPGKPAPDINAAVSDVAPALPAAASALASDAANAVKAAGATAAAAPGK